MTISLGTHWMATARSGVSLNEQTVQEILMGMAETVGLTALGEPVVREGDLGWIGVLLLAESHASLHQNRAESMVFVDLFSCVPFDTAQLERFMRTQLNCEELSVEQAARGLL